MALEVVCITDEEITQGAATLFGSEDLVLIKGREQIYAMGTIMELYDQKDGAQENPFFCIRLHGA